MIGEDLAVGLYGYKIPLAFLIRGEAGNIGIHLGIWSPSGQEGAPAAVLDERHEILGTVLRSLYPAIDLMPAAPELSRPMLAGLVLGIPTPGAADAADAALPIDRLVRALHGARWAALVLAEPVDEGWAGSLRDTVINEIRSVQAAAGATTAPSPLAEHYSGLLNVALGSLCRGEVWRTAVYLLGDETSYHRLASVWRSIFSGEASLPEPVRVWESSDAAMLAARWAMPDATPAPGPGLYHHPFEYQTLLTSAQLAAYIQLPTVETGGFAIRLVPEFDVVPAQAEEADGVSLGPVVDRTRLTTTQYPIRAADLKRHALIAGVTGSGKTNTVFHLLVQLWRRQVPFLVLEPAKTEYRALLTHPDLGHELRVFTLGDEHISPLRMNPLEAGAGVSVATHIDLLKSVFNASFGMWTPLPQVLERCIHEVYRDFGWDTLRGLNRRLEPSGNPKA
jgi:hypothetical protein